MSQAAKVTSIPDDVKGAKRGARIIEVIADTADAVEACLKDIVNHRNVKTAVFSPIVEFSDHDFRASGHVICKLYHVKREMEEVV